MKPPDSNGPGNFPDLCVLAITLGCPEFKQQDLIWESMKRYCAMVLDEESREFLGTAVLFVQQPVHTDQHLEAGLPRTCKSAWVTSVNALAGRKQVLVQNSNGESHLAVLLLRSVTFGLVFLSVHKMSGTFGLAFLSMVTSPSSLPHRSFVDAQHGDLVYVFGYSSNLPWNVNDNCFSNFLYEFPFIQPGGRSISW